MKELQKKSPRHLPLKVGDKVVICPHKSNTHERGRVGTIVHVRNHLTVDVTYEGDKHPLVGFHGIPTYNIRHASECHRCVHRVTHLTGAMCPQSWKEVKFVDEEMPNG